MSTENEESKKAFYKALSKMQGELEHAKKDSVNPHFKSKYADLTSCLDAAKQVLSANGFSFMHTFASVDSMVFVSGHLSHEFGHRETSTLPLVMGKNDMQSMGSAITYARRYIFSALIGQGADDDDGQNASTPTTIQRQASVAPAKVNNISVKTDGGQIIVTPATKVTLNITNPEHRSLIGRALKETGLEVWVAEGNNKNLITAHLAGEKPMADLKSIIDSITRYAVTATKDVPDVQL
jgi:hypothetical protein